jgi:3-oxoacyl-[acyl-carrier-protein] synthase II
MMEDVWVTGLGAVTPAGTGTAPLLEALRGERCCLRPVDELGGVLAGEVDMPAVDRHLRRMDRSGVLFHAAATEAWRGAGLDACTFRADRVGLLEGSSLATLPALLEARRVRGLAGGSLARAADLLRFMPGAGGASFAQGVGIQGPVMQLSAGSVSAAFAIGEGYQKVAAGLLDVVVCGGGDSPLQPEVLDAFALSGVLAGDRDPRDLRGPFDAERAGTVLGEAAAALVLESARHAAARGARPLAILRGFGAAAESHSPVAPDPTGAVVRAAVERALTGMPERVGWIKAHATATKAGDAAECAGLARVFGQRLPGIPMTGLKTMLGHSLGASGAVEAVASVLALVDGFVPACVATRRVDPALPACRIAMHREQAASNGVALLLSESFGGRCAALVISH